MNGQMLFFAWFIVFSILLVRSECESKVNVSNTSRQFPEGFMFGASSAAYQIEGAWNIDGKGPSIWDDFTHSYPHKVVNGENGDIAANSYEYYQDDVDAVKDLNVHFYRFSVSWSRILPTGDITQVNEKGIEYYNKLIDALIEKKIQPVVTMHHFDLPKQLQLFGGFTNSVIVKYFEEYANLLYARFSDRVKYWTTINEPAEFCVQGYGTDNHAPALNAHGIGEYLCGHNVLKAHAVAYRLYKNKYFNRFKGQVGISLDSLFYYSDTNDTITVERAMQFSLGWFGHPIYSAIGGYPPTMIDQIGNNSKNEGRMRSRLPTFSEYWIEQIRGSSDFFGLNYYTSRMVVVPNEPMGPNPSRLRDSNFERLVKPEWIQGGSEWLYSVPQGIGDMLRWIKKEYNNPHVIITENGWSDRGDLNDDSRIAFYHDHLDHVLDAMDDGCNVGGYAVWSLIDNFEWISGYTEHFGLYYVNMSSPRRERIPKKSSHFMRTLIASGSIPEIP